MPQKRRRNTHHYIPRSRGGSNARVNQKRKVRVRQHDAWHRLFENLKPCEVCRQLQEWHATRHVLNLRRHENWKILFGGRSYLDAIEIVQKFWTRHDQRAPLYLAAFLGEREHYPVRIDFLSKAAALLKAFSPDQETQFEALKAIARNTFQALSKEKAESEKDPKPGDASQPILDVQLDGIAKIFSTREMYRIEERVPLQISYDGYFLTKLDKELRTKDGVIRYVEPERLSELIIYPLVAAIVYGEIVPNDKIIFTVQKNQTALWRQKRNGEK